MKRFVSVIFIMLLTLSLLTTLGMSAFAAETPDGAGELTDNVATGVGQFTKVLEGLLEQAKGFLHMHNTPSSMYLCNASMVSSEAKIAGKLVVAPFQV